MKHGDKNKYSKKYQDSELNEFSNYRKLKQLKRYEEYLLDEERIEFRLYGNN